MKKIFLFLFAVTFTTVQGFAQRIGSFSLYDNTTSSTLVSLVPFAAFNPTNNSTTATGDGQIVYAGTVNLTNATATIGCGTQATVTAPSPLPADWSATVTGIKVQDDGTVDTNWALYSITAKKITPASLPLTINTGSSSSLNTANWTSESCPGWAAVCTDKTTTNLFKLGSAGRSVVLAFTNNPDTLRYTLNYSSGTWAGSTNVLDIDGSADGINWTSIRQSTGTTNVLTTTATVFIDKISKTYRFVRFIFSVRNTCNLNIQNIYVSKNSDQGIPTGISNVKSLKASIYPNPVGEMLNISSEETISKVEIFSQLGQLVLSSANAQHINVSQLSKGVYLAHIKSEGGETAVIRFVK
jgi:hypothetical protein